MFDVEKDIFIKKWVCGPLGVNCYICGSHSDKEVILIDPGEYDENIPAFIEAEGLEPILIVATHGHLDHILGIPDFKNRWGIEVACHPMDVHSFSDPDPFLEGFLGRGIAPFVPERHLEDGDKISVGPYALEVLHTPGHTPGSICLLGPHFLFSGDLLFNAGIGRTDLPGGNYNTLVDSVRRRIWPLSDDLILLPLGILIAVRLIPRPVMQECRAQSRDRMRDVHVTRWWAGAVVIVVWVVAVTVIGWYAYRFAVPHLRLQ